MERTAHQQIIGVTELTQQIKHLLEKQFPMVWVTGEVSNCRRPASGHCYFTLKDESSQIAAVMFRSQVQRLTFSLEDGLRLVGLGRISVYPPRGNYQLIFEYLEPEGRGALQLAFEQLKAKLASEGLFDPAIKRPLPYLPRHICVITSPTGAAVRDIIHVLRRRFPGLRISVLPVRVQGEGAVGEIERALDTLAALEDADVAILTRGGGSLEDLMAYNDERIARAIRRCAVPVVSAVGHETDYTIADFAADVRAPTPSAAAELTVPESLELDAWVTDHRRRLIRAIRQRLTREISAVHEFRKRLRDPRRQVADDRLHLDDVTQRMIRSMAAHVRNHRERLDWRLSRLRSRPLRIITANANKKLLLNKHKILNLFANIISEKRSALVTAAARLNALSPLSVLDRGYSITRLHPMGTVVRSVKDVSVDQRVDVVVRDGALTTRVSDIVPD